jgi:hypothetical protein
MFSLISQSEALRDVYISTQRKRQQSQQARVQDHNGMNGKRKPRKEIKEI